MIVACPRVRADITVVVRGGPREIVRIFVVCRPPGEILRIVGVVNAYAAAETPSCFGSFAAAKSWPMPLISRALLVDCRVAWRSFSCTCSEGRIYFYPELNPF